MIECAALFTDFYHRGASMACIQLTRQETFLLGQCKSALEVLHKVEDSCIKGGELSQETLRSVNYLIHDLELAIRLLEPVVTLDDIKKTTKVFFGGSEP